MARTDYSSIDAYIAAQPEASRPVLETVRAAIRAAIPEAAETISYQIPAYRLPGGVVIFFAGWKQHYSLYPLTDAVTQAFAAEIAGYVLSKGTIRFPLSEPVPVKLIEGIASIRAQETAAAAEAKAAARKARRVSARSSRASTAGSRS